ncbi:probable beta-glucosidase M [Aspergillus lentulus]|nr:probable beta-glucosidase M [Aspergillus lentulus]
MINSRHILLVIQVFVLSLVTTSADQGVNFTSLELFWSYGRSPAVYPSPPGKGLGDWAPAYRKAKAAVKKLSNEEKNNITFGYNSYALANFSGCAGLSLPLPRIGYPGMCLADASNGLRGTDFVNAYPAGIHAGASWNRSLVYHRGLYMGEEFKAKGVNVINGPVIGPLGRTARGGRNWEGFSADPYLAGVLVAETIQGLQKSVIASVKHFIAYEQETARGPEGNNASYSSNLDDKTMHELYLWPFANAVHAGVGSVMCSYNRVNNSYACQNSKILNGLLKTELGFQGFVVSDWNAQLTGISSANAGLDMAMPDSPYWQGNLSLAVANGTMSQERLDDMATRILAAYYKLAPHNHPGSGMPPVIINSPVPTVDARNPESRPTIFQGAVEGQVLVKNINHALPLLKPRSISVFGYDAGLPPKTNPAFSLKWYLGYEALDLADSVELTNLSHLATFPEAATLGTLIGGGGSGASVPSYISTPFAALVEQATVDGTYISWDLESFSPTVPVSSDACLVFVNEFATESRDRPGLADPQSDRLIMSVASQCPNTIVVIHNAGVRIVDAWIENPNITALIFSHLPGQDSGKAVTEILYGRQSPSGRLPYTVARKPSDYGPLLDPTGPESVSDYYIQANYTEGVNIDYRHFLAHNITPRFEFGYGLTYTTFRYSALQLSRAEEHCFSTRPPGTEIAEGGLPSLWANIATVKVQVMNTGNFTASEVAQLYIGIPGGPQKVLRGFDKVMLAPGQKALINFQLTRRDLSSWDVNSQSWILQSGNYLIHVGASVLDIRLTGSLSITSSSKC